MELTKLVPTAIIILMVLSAIPYVFTGDWRRAVFWVAAAILNFVATF